MGIPPSSLGGFHSKAQSLAVISLTLSGPIGALGTSRTVTCTSAESDPLQFLAVIVSVPFSFRVAALTISLML